MAAPLVALLLLAHGSDPLSPADDARHRQARDYIDAQIGSGETPGLQYVILRADSVIFAYAGGSASVEHHQPIEPSTTMMAYSMTKTFTAAAVLQLVEAGRIRLDDPVQNYLPEIPYGTGVTIRHLLTQTSGIPNPIPLRWVHLVGDHREFSEQRALDRILTDNDELSFTPGSKYGYSNISSWLLGHVIRKASGVSYEEYVRTNIFRRLGMPPGEADFVIPDPAHHARGYLPRWSWMNLFKSFVIDPAFVGEYEEGWLHINEHYVNGPAFGGIVATARALALFLADMLRPDPLLFSAETKKIFFTQQRTTGGEPVEMTHGWHIGSENGVAFYFKEGGGGGFHAEMRVYPAAGCASIVIANNTTFDVKSFLRTTDGFFLPAGN